MSGWNALAALAAGGEAYLDHREKTRKEKLAIQLEKDRIAGEVQRDIDKEARAAKKEAETVDHQALVEESPGNWVAQDYNKGHKPLGTSRPANPDEILTWTEKVNKSKTAGLELDLATKKLGEYDEDSALSRRVKESQIRANDRKGVADEEDEVAPPPEGDVVAELWKDSEDLIKQYTGTPDKPGVVQPNQLRELAEKVVHKTFFKEDPADPKKEIPKPRNERRDIREAFRIALQQYTNDPRVLPKKTKLPD